MDGKAIYFGTHTRFLPCSYSYLLTTQVPLCADCTAHHRAGRTGSRLVQRVERQDIPTSLDRVYRTVETHVLRSRPLKPRTPQISPTLLPSPKPAADRHEIGRGIPSRFACAHLASTRACTMLASAFPSRVSIPLSIPLFHPAFPELPLRRLFLCRPHVFTHPVSRCSGSRHAEILSEAMRYPASLSWKRYILAMVLGFGPRGASSFAMYLWRDSWYLI
jgi:hypothetical protein